MQAIVQRRYGSPDYLELRDVEMPVVGDDDVLVRVRAASLHPDVWHVVMGQPSALRLMGGGFSRPRNPIPGTDMAGIVEATGRNVTRFRSGDAVFGETLPRMQWAHGGAFAEYVAVHQELLARKPDRVSFEQAASVPASGFIVLNNLRDVKQWRPGKRVLINGAGGGVGTLALQIAKAHGARVTAVDTTSKLDMMQALGADKVVDYTQENVIQRGDRYDLIVDIPMNHPLAAWRSILEEDGRYVPIGHEGYGASGRSLFGLIPYFIWLVLLSRFVKQLRGPRVPFPTKAQAITILADLLERGAITPIIDSTYPLREVHEAFRHLTEDQTHGKVILTPVE